MTWKQAIAYIDDDELVEVTPKIIRLRKRFLDPNERKRQAARADQRGAMRPVTASAPLRSSATMISPDRGTIPVSAVMFT